MLYDVRKKFGPGRETSLEKFHDMKTARQFIQEKLAEDRAHKINATYCIYEGFDLMEELDQSALIETTSSGSSSGSSSSQGAGQSAAPTPFSMRPQPKGMPHSWGQKTDDERSDK